MSGAGSESSVTRKAQRRKAAIVAASLLAAGGGGWAWVASNSSGGAGGGDGPKSGAQSKGPASGDQRPPFRDSAGQVVPDLTQEPRGMEGNPEHAQRKWPGIDTDLSAAPPLYWARVKPERLDVLRKPKLEKAEAAYTAWHGQLVAVLAEEGPPVTFEGKTTASKPVRVGDIRGWAPQDALEKLEVTPPEPMSLWERLRQAVGPDTLPGDCPASVLAAELSTAHPGPEYLVMSITGHQCRSALGVFGSANGEPLLGYFQRPLMVFLGVTPPLGGTSLLDVQSVWAESNEYSGGTNFLLAVPPQPGPLAVLFEAPGYSLDNRGAPPVVSESAFARIDPDGDGQWMLQWRHTIRRKGNDGAPLDTVNERFYSFDGQRFVESPRPAGVEDLPAMAPSEWKGTFDELPPDNP